MANTNFQTFHQMGGAISDFVKQATGREIVKNIDIDHVTVAQNHYYEEIDISGSMVSFTTETGGIPLEKCVVQIEPVQSGEGDPAPDNVRPITGFTGANVTRAGKNLLKNDLVSVTRNNVVFTKNADGTVTVSGIATANISVNVLGSSPNPYKGFLKGIYIISKADTDNNIRLSINMYNGTTWIKQFVTSSTDNVEFAIDYDGYDGVVVAIFIPNGANVSKTIKPMIRFADELDDNYEPYSGIDYSITFPSEAETVYGGTLDVVSGELVVDRMNIASYNGETLPGKWISDRDVYAEGTTPTMGSQVVYELAEPINYQLTPTEITTLLGTNNIWADTGDIEVKFRDLKELY